MDETVQTAVSPDIGKLLISMTGNYLREVITVLENTAEVVKQIEPTLTGENEYKLETTPYLLDAITKGVQLLSRLADGLNINSPWHHILDGVTYDTNGPMATILGYSDAILTGLDAEHPARPLILQIMLHHEGYKKARYKFIVGKQIIKDAGVLNNPTQS